jgi:hypothetical protein
MVHQRASKLGDPGGLNPVYLRAREVVAEVVLVAVQR